LKSTVIYNTLLLAYFTNRVAKSANKGKTRKFTTEPKKDAPIPKKRGAKYGAPFGAPSGHLFAWNRVRVRRFNMVAAIHRPDHQVGEERNDEQRGHTIHSSIIEA
tara:strand:- start:3 stop:317 length:315 start_codon:yes stop_codon:yes gene_type:complete